MEAIIIAGSLFTLSVANMIKLARKKNKRFQQRKANHWENELRQNAERYVKS